MEVCGNLDLGETYLASVSFTTIIDNRSINQGLYIILTEAEYGDAVEQADMRPAHGLGPGTGQHLRHHLGVDIVDIIDIVNVLCRYYKYTRYYKCSVWML